MTIHTIETTINCNTEYRNKLVAPALRALESIVEDNAIVGDRKRIVLSNINSILTNALEQYLRRIAIKQVEVASGECYLPNLEFEFCVTDGPTAVVVQCRQTLRYNGMNVILRDAMRNLTGKRFMEYLLAEWIKELGRASGLHVEALFAIMRKQ